MEIGRAEIVVVAGMMMGVIMVMPMIIAMPVMVMPAHQEQRAGDIDREAQHRNQRGAREIDAHGIEEAEEGFDRDPDREDAEDQRRGEAGRSEEHTSELQSLMRNSYAVFCLKKKK